MHGRVALVTGASRGVARGAALRDRGAMRWSGRVAVAVQFALECGFRDVDGSQPRPLGEAEA
jgi:NAD(P)-dependent dehydrogenase (short-subunit alcohol dehydrogenase family)